jgi:hypothetical protein
MIASFRYLDTFTKIEQTMQSLAQPARAAPQAAREKSWTPTARD